jgi:DNA (cytosine-5)-methyltransferase 1
LEAGLPGAGQTRVKYEVAEVATLHTEAYGVPQTRRRTILIARLAKHGTPRLPRPTHHVYHPHKPEQGGPTDKNVATKTGQTAFPIDEGTTQLRPWVTMGEVLDRKSPFEIRSNYGSGGDPKKRGIRSYLPPGRSPVTPSGTWTAPRTIRIA